MEETFVEEMSTNKATAVVKDNSDEDTITYVINYFKDKAKVIREAQDFVEDYLKEAM